MSLSEPYTLLPLPRVSLTHDRAKLIHAFTPDELHIGISGASISHYILKPSPKLVWSHSIPPGVIVTAVDEVEDRYVVGVYNKTTKGYGLQVIERMNNDSRILRDASCGSKVLGIRAVKNNEDGGTIVVVVVLEDAIVCYDEGLNKEVWRVQSLYTATYAQFIENDLVLVVEVCQAKNTLNFKLVLITTGLEVESKIVEGQCGLGSGELAFTYSDGILYQYLGDVVTMYRVPRFQDFKTIDLLELGAMFSTSSQNGSIDNSNNNTNTNNKNENNNNNDDNDNNNSNVTMSSPASNRLLLAKGKDLYLINTNFNVILSHTTAKSTLEILQVEKPAKKRIRPAFQFFGVVLRDGDVAGLSFTLDSNTLRDSLGKKKTIRNNNSENNNSPGDRYRVASTILSIKDELIDINDVLQSSDINKTLKFFMKADHDFYTEKDKLVSANFIKRVVEHALLLTPLPERALMYLLTHPLFPLIEGLLEKLRSEPRLLRQAVVTGNVAVSELLKELETTDNDEIFKDVVSRLLGFSKEKLNFKDLDNYKIVDRIIRLNYGYELIPSLIDSSGLFVWNEELVAKLQSVLSVKIDALNSASKAVAVIEQAELKNLKTVKKIPVYSVEKIFI